jgi:hypothetical protein
VTIPGQFTAGGNDISVSFTSPDPAVINDIDSNSPFPAGDITIGGLSANVSTGNAVQLGDSSRNISFTFSAGTTYTLAVISDPSAVLKALNANTNIASGIDLTTGTVATDRFMLLKLVYNLGATVKGTAALAAGVTANFGATGQVNGDWDVVHRFGGEGARDVLGATISAWRLPRQINAPSQLDPGTWLIAEIAGSIALSLGVQAGYNYSWLKKLSGGNLTGNIGVKVALGATASLGFSANGNFALALSRPDATNKLRLAIYKLARNDWNFALNASAGVQGVLPPALQSSKDPTDLIKAIFGVHATQLINDLQTVQKVAAGGNLTDQAANYLEGLGKKELGAAANAVDAFNKGVDTANNFISQLNTLGQRTMSQIFALLPSSANGGANAIADLTTVLTDVKNVAADPTQIASIITSQLQNVAFFQTNFGKWLTSLLQDAGQASPLSALKDNSVLQAIGTAASTTLNLVNGGDLQTLIDFAADKLDLRNIPALPNIDTWLKTKIAAFLNEAIGSVGQQDVAKVQNLVNNLFNKADTFWTEAIKAAQKQYEATFVATWESTTTDTAMLDLVFDFDANPNLGTQLQAAINGDFTQILVDPSIAGIALNTGVLTHGIHRQTHVEITLPFLDLGTTSATDAVANMTVKHDGGGRVLAYNVQANNDVKSFIAGRSARDSQMTLIMNVDVPAGVEKAPDFQASFGYSLRAANAKTTNRQLITMLTPLVTSYSLPLQPSEVENWVIDLDKITEAAPTGQIGSALVSLDVAIDSSLPNVWFSAPENSKDPVYIALSKRIQQQLRQLISSQYFAQANRYGTFGVSYPLLVYASLRPMNSFDIDQDAIPNIVALTNDDVYWNWPDEGHMIALMHDPVTVNATLANMSTANQILTSLGDTDNAGYYTPDNLSSVWTAALSKSNPSSQLPDLLGRLIGFEARFISAVIGAATDLAKFAGTSTKDPTAAMKALTDFSAATVKTFNQGLSSNLFGGDELEMLGSALFTQVTMSLAEALNSTVPANGAPSALFSISIPKPSANLSPANLQSGKYTPDQILVEQKLASPLANFAATGALVH